MPKAPSNEIKLTFKERKDYIAEAKEELATKMGKAQATLILQKVPQSEVRTRKLNPRNPKSPTFKYIEHAFVTETLNYAFKLNWDLVVTERERIDEQAIVHGYLEVRFPNGEVVRKHASGAMKYISNNANMTWADAYNGAISRMLRAAAARLGLGLEFYKTEGKAMESAENEKSFELPKTPILDDAQAKQTATTAQINALSNLKIQFDPDNITFGEAARLLTNFAKNKND